MSRYVEISYKGEKYRLEFTRRSVQIMEQNGFKISELHEKPISTLPELFRGAFYANHRFVKDELIDEIFDSLPQKGELLGKLIELYQMPIRALIDDPDEENEGNASWEANW